ncbi:Sjogren's syndrome/scleroderma autoantigen 1 family protein [Candidatus Hodarchaeum mangrovi]
MAKKGSQSTSDDITKMSGLLLSGATMLGDICPDCKVPLFKKGNDIFCPKCERKAVYARSDKEISAIQQIYSQNELQELLRDIVLGKINYITQKLAGEEKLSEIKHLSEILDVLITVLIKIKKI